MSSGGATRRAAAAAARRRHRRRGGTIDPRPSPGSSPSPFPNLTPHCPSPSPFPHLPPLRPHPHAQTRPRPHLTHPLARTFTPTPTRRVGPSGRAMRRAAAAAVRRAPRRRGGPPGGAAHRSEAVRQSVPVRQSEAARHVAARAARAAAAAAARAAAWGVTRDRATAAARVTAAVAGVVAAGAARRRMRRSRAWLMTTRSLWQAWAARRKSRGTRMRTKSEAVLATRAMPGCRSGARMHVAGLEPNGRSHMPLTSPALARSCGTCRHPPDRRDMIRRVRHVARPRVSCMLYLVSLWREKNSRWLFAPLLAVVKAECDIVFTLAA